MKTKEELLRIYSAYLPYELKFISNNERYQLTGIELEKEYPLWASTNWDEKTLEWKPGINNKIRPAIGYGFKYNEVKPLLWSMDMLTKEIEHKGERFNVINELRSIFPNAPMFDEYINYGHFKSIKLIDSKVEYCVVMKLIEWHFNVFNLEESEFIKKETLNK